MCCVTCVTYFLVRKNKEKYIGGTCCAKDMWAGKECCKVQKCGDKCCDDPAKPCRSDGHVVLMLVGTEQSVVSQVKDVLEDVVQLLDKRAKDIKLKLN